MELNNKQVRHLKALGHHLHALVQVGNKGATDAVVEKTSTELGHHELIKVKVGQGCGKPKDIGAALAEATSSELVQVLGRTLLLYRPDPDDGEIILP